MDRFVLALVLVVVLFAGSAGAQQRTITINRHESFTVRNKTAEKLGYVGAGLTAFLALLDSSTGARQTGVPVPGYQTYPGATWTDVSLGLDAGAAAAGR